MPKKKRFFLVQIMRDLLALCLRAQRAENRLLRDDPDTWRRLQMVDASDSYRAF
jgi:hypothetical protein